MISINNIEKRYDNHQILSDISLKFEDGHIYGFVGRNGSGKTVLLNVICGFAQPNNGVVIYDDVDIYKSKIFLPNTRALIEKPKFIDDISGYKNLELLAKINGVIGKDEIDNVLKMVNLFEDKDKIYKKYSLGMKQKLGIAQVIMEKPKVMIFDEPFNGLDNETVSKIRMQLLKYKEDGKIIIISTHIKEDVELLCDSVFFLDNAKISRIK
ncbi:MAG: ABC transporter ATP-binding protein [Bacilli bacterium]|nr:ABC transporter ATP-binding protein [Bacilli bacterium]MDD4054038.1 ABC transporter ATP-binding protein [Bacilli bacterium]MDD4411810.1 ABC transporter ATP-binding protein [Bacilli bacterium]